MQTHPERFPNVLKGVADHIHVLGLKAGIYSDAGSHTCGSIRDNDQHGIVQVGMDMSTKMSHVSSRSGVDIIKIDYCEAGQELNMDEERRYTEFRKAFDVLGCDHVSLNIAAGHSQAHSWRNCADISPDWNSVKYIIGKNLYLKAYAGDGHYNDMDMLEFGWGLTPSEEEVHFGM